MHLSISLAFSCPTIPPGAVGGDLTNQIFKCPTVWEGQVIKSPPIPCIWKQLGGKPKVYFPALRVHFSFKTKSNPPPFPTHCPKGGIVGHTIDTHISLTVCGQTSKCCSTLWWWNDRDHWSSHIPINRILRINISSVAPLSLVNFLASYSTQLQSCWHCKIINF